MHISTGSCEACIGGTIRRLSSMFKVTFASLRLDNHIIHIVLKLAMHHVVEDCGHCPLVRRTGILQPKGHHSKVEVTNRSLECSLHCVFWRYPNLVVAAKTIHEREHGMPSSSVN